MYVVSSLEQYGMIRVVYDLEGQLFVPTTKEHICYVLRAILLKKL